MPPVLWTALGSAIGVDFETERHIAPSTQSMLADSSGTESFASRETR